MINKKVKDLKPYDVIEYKDYIKLDANESFISLSQEKRELLSSIAKDIDYNRYPSSLAEGVCQAFGDIFDIKTENITAGNGSDELISIIINGLCQKQDTVVCASPDFSMYSFYSYIAEIKCIELKKDEAFNIDVEETINQIKSINPRMVIFSNPCNPTGLAINREDVLKIAKSFSGILVLDEAYMDFSDNSVIQDFREYKNLIILKTCSKAFGLAALRLGFAVADTEITKALKAIKSPFNLNTVTQSFGEALLKDKQYLKESIEKIKNSRDYLYKELLNLNLKVLPPSANFLVVITSDSQRIYTELLNRKILVRKFKGFLRITCGSDAENKALISALKEIIK